MIMPDLTSQLPLFVFGTLRRGHLNHHYLAGHYHRALPAELHGYTRLHPLMIESRAGGIVNGELYFLRDDRYDETLRDCDALEGIPPGRSDGPEYCRKAVDVTTREGRFSAWAYVHPDNPGIPSRGAT